MNEMNEMNEMNQNNHKYFLIIKIKMIYQILFKTKFHYYQNNFKI
jgi:hypothetical protein